MLPEKAVACIFKGVGRFFSGGRRDMKKTKRNTQPPRNHIAFALARRASVGAGRHKRLGRERDKERRALERELKG